MNRNTIENLKWKKPVRVLAYPIEQMRRKLRLWQYQHSEDSLYIKTIKDIHKGESCFVIGNGPSLTEADLETLNSINVACFAANRIYKIFPRTEWRPAYYLCLDKYVARTNYEQIRHIGNFPKFIDFSMNARQRKKEDNIHFLCNYAHFEIDYDKRIPKTLSSDISTYSTFCGTVTVNSIELAIYMGFSRIYLLGVDNNYTHKRRSDGTVYIDPTVKSSYFLGGEPEKSDGVSVQSAEIVDGSYEVAKQYAEKHGVNIYNATRGGKLEIFERVDFDEVIQKIQQEKKQ